MSAKQKYQFRKTNDCGFTLVEMLIVLLISTIIAIGAITAYSVQSKSFSGQRDISKLQQDLRGAFYLMEYDLINACRDPRLTNRFSITDVRYYDFTQGALDNTMGPTPFNMPGALAPKFYFASYPVLEFTSLRRDRDLDGEGDWPMRIRYQVYDFNNDGRLDLGRRVDDGVNPNVVTANVDLVAEGVVAIGYAFAYNANPNGRYQVSRTPPLVGGDPLGNTIWAIDSDGDNRLDLNIDVTGDGQVTLADDISGDGIINALDSANAILPAARANIQNVTAVRIWLLLESDRKTPGNQIDTNLYVVGDRVIPNPVANPNGFQDSIKRRVKTITVALRNYRKS